VHLKGYYDLLARTIIDDSEYVTVLNLDTRGVTRGGEAISLPST
jgi:hypothetical protein